MRRRSLWVVAAAVLFVAAAVVLTATEDGPTPTRRADVAFPRYPRDHEVVRNRMRATLAVPLAADAPADEPPARRDPFLVALPAGPDDPVVVLEANALRHSRIGELLVRCALAREPGLFDDLHRESGIDVLEDVDRVGFAGDALVMSGFFEEARWERLAAEPGMVVSRYGDGGRIYAHEQGDVVATVGDGLIVFGDEAAVRQAIDQVEGRAPAPESGLSEDLAYGEIYGVLPGAAARRLAAGDDAIGAKIGALARQVELHVDAMSDVAAVVRVAGDDRAGMQDLAKTLGAALAAARLQARARDEDRLAELLDFARVSPEGAELSLELALPIERLEAWFGSCAAGETDAAAATEDE